MSIHITAKWFKGEAWRLLPNIEFSHQKHDHNSYIEFVWLKFIISFWFHTKE